MKKEIKKKYQVFISSTYEDLIDERKDVVQAILEGGWIRAKDAEYYNGGNASVAICKPQYFEEFREITTWIEENKVVYLSVENMSYDVAYRMVYS